jgi:NADH:ubiquinone oxidoreductase subunit 5 (subunit L)/multisubunit Na+/H+ antiporter MnhA subunit
VEIASVRLRTFVYAIVGAALLAGVVVMGVLAGRTAEAAAAASQQEQKAYLARLAWVCVVVAALTAVVLIWVVVRFFAFRLQAGRTRSRTEHLDAWSLAGKRFQLTKEEEERLESTWGEEEP